jgi:hypothetical protein
MSVNVLTQYSCAGEIIGRPKSLSIRIEQYRAYSSRPHGTVASGCFVDRIGPQRARNPPSTTRPVPVTNDESSEHNHNIASATSCDCPSLPTGSIAA